MTSETDLAKARRRLASVNRRIDAHPLNSSSFRRARAVVKEHEGASIPEIRAALRREHLPGPGAMTRRLLIGSATLARLNRKRIRLEKRIAAFER